MRAAESEGRSGIKRRVLVRSRVYCQVGAYCQLLNRGETWEEYQYYKRTTFIEAFAFSLGNERYSHNANQFQYSNLTNISDSPIFEESWLLISTSQQAEIIL
jgi:hypothetical protein